MKILGKWLLVYVLYFILMMASFSQYYLNGKLPFTSDDPNKTFGHYKEQINDLKKGRFVTWYSDYNLGMNGSGWDPSANPNRLPNLIMSLLPFDTGKMYIVNLHMTMALMGFAMFLLLDRMKFNYLLCFFGGLIYMFNPMTDEYHYIGFWTYGLIATPLGILFLHEWMKDNNRYICLILWGLLSGVLYLSGGLMVLLWAYGGIALYAVALIFIHSWDIKQVVSCYAFLVISGLFALLLGAYIFLPSFDYYFLKESRIRLNDTSFFYLDKFSMETFVRRITSFIFPFDYQIYLPNYDWGLAIKEVNFPGKCRMFFGDYWRYLNILALPAILINIQKWKNTSRKIKGLLLFTLVYYAAFLNPSIINPDFILRIFPFYSFSKNYGIYYVALTIIIVWTIRDLEANRFDIGKRVKNFINGFASFYLFLSIISFGLFVLYLVYGSSRLASDLFEKYHSIITVRMIEEQYFTRNTVIFVSFLFLARSAQIFLFRKYNYKSFVYLVTTVLVLEYACFSRIYYPFMDQDTRNYNTGKTIESSFMQKLGDKDRIAYQRANINRQNYKMDFEGLNPLEIPIQKIKEEKRKFQKFEYLLHYEFRYDSDVPFFGVYNIAMSKDFHQFYSRLAKGNPLYVSQINRNFPYVHNWPYNLNEQSPLCRPIFNYLITQNAINLPHLPKIVNGEYYSIYKNNLALPRVYFVFETVFAPDLQKSLDLLEDSEFDWKKSAVVNDPKSVIDPSQSGDLSYNVISQKIFYSDIKIEIETNRMGMLIINDLFYPYWKATDNGKDVEIIKANGIFRGIILEKGRHTVEMHFCNPWLKAGIWVSLISALICIGALLYTYKCS